MRVKEVVYNRLFNLAGYQNEKIGFTAEITENDDEEKVMAELFFKVLKIERTFEKYRLLNSELGGQQQELGRLKQDLKWRFERLAQLEAERAEIENDERRRCRIFDIDEQIKRTIEEIDKLKEKISRQAEKINNIIDELKIVEEAIKKGNFEEIGDFEKVDPEDVIASAKTESMF